MIYELIWWCVPLVAIPLWLITNGTHEALGHGVWVLPWKWRFKTYILAHFYDSTTGETHNFWTKWGWFKKDARPTGVSFYFARCDFIRTEQSQKIPDWGEALIYIGPRLVNTVFMAICLVLVHIVHAGHRAGTILAVWYAANIVDAGVGFGSIFSCQRRDSTDLWRFQSYAGWNIWLVRTICLVWFGIMLTAFLWRLS